MPQYNISPHHEGVQLIPLCNNLFIIYFANLMLMLSEIDPCLLATVNFSHKYISNTDISINK